MENIKLKELFKKIADSIRTKDGTTEPIAAKDFPEHISNISVGGNIEIPPEMLEMKDNPLFLSAKSAKDAPYTYFFFKAVADSGKEITTENLKLSYGAFEFYPFKKLPIKTINVAPDSNLVDCFLNSKIEEIPQFKGNLNFKKNHSIAHMFQQAYSLKYIPQDFFDNLGGDEFWNQRKQSTDEYDCSFFRNLYSLRKLPKMNRLLSNVATRTQHFYGNGNFNELYCLDEIKDIPVDMNGVNIPTDWMIDDFYRIKSFTFETNNGEPLKPIAWSPIVLNLIYNVGYGSRYSIVEQGGISADKEVSNADSYNRLKNDPDWFTTNNWFARYNKNSALETIKSLPDLTGCNSTSTINFRKLNGRDTDGGAIQNLTADEIAIANAKGWTVGLL